MMQNLKIKRVDWTLLVFYACRNTFYCI